MITYKIQFDQMGREVKCILFNIVENKTIQHLMRIDKKSILVQSNALYVELKDEQVLLFCIAIQY